MMTAKDPPKKHQSNTIDDELAPSRAHLQSLESEILEAQNHPLGLQAKQAESLQNFVDEHTSTHICRLPTETLVQVFMLALPKRFFSPFRPEEAPLVLGQVCRWWRAVSRSTPLLWSTIHIEAIQTEGHRAVMLEWLERSRPCPLTVTYKPQANGGLERAILAGIAPRLEHLDITINIEWLPTLLSMDGFNSLDALQSLHLTFTQVWRNLQSSEPITQIDLSTRVPRLTNICVDLQVTPQLLILPYTQITVCDLVVNDNASFALLLQEAVNLVDCYIFINSFIFDAPPRSPVRHTTLEKLGIEVFKLDHDSNILGSILPWLDLPSLREFIWNNHGAFHLSRYAPGWPMPTFLDFLSRSGCTLSRLWIDTGATEEDILRYLVEVPSVVDLAIGPWPSNQCPRKLMQGLTLGSHSRPDGTDLVPNLEHLRIHGGWSQCEEMMQAIESRFSAGNTVERRRLKTIALDNALVEDNYLGNTQERLNKCVGEGLLYVSW